jgi:exodeoxyribonuclease VII small subunit
MAMARKKENAQDQVVGPESEMTYEMALAKLEETVSRLEAGALPLEDSLKAFDEGVGLIRLLTGRLDAMERRMMVLLDGEDGVKAVPMDERDL